MSGSVGVKGTSPPASEGEFFIDNLLVRIHFIIVMIAWTGLAPWEFEFLFLGSLTSTFLNPLASRERCRLPPNPSQIQYFAKVNSHTNPSTYCSCW